MTIGRGEIWWGEADSKGRPFLILTRNEAIPVLRSVLVAPITRTIRHIPTEVPVGTPKVSRSHRRRRGRASSSIPKSLLVRRMGALSPSDNACLLRRALRGHRLLTQPLG